MKRLALYHIETLLWINQLGSFSAAAVRLNTTQPGVSARVREIEARLGVKIFRREGRRMLLTVAGRQLVRDCEPRWSELEQILLDIGHGGVARGVVLVGSGELAASSILPKFISDTRSDLPGVTLDVTIDVSGQLLEWLLGGTKDLIFLSGPVVTPQIMTAPLGQVGLIWLAAPSVASKLKQDHCYLPPIWSLPTNSPFHRLMLACLKNLGLKHNVINTCNNVRTLIDIVRLGEGVTFLPTTMAYKSVKEGHLEEVFSRPAEKIMLEVAVRAGERDPIILRVFERAKTLKIQNPF